MSLAQKLTTTAKKTISSGTKVWKLVYSYMQIKMASYQTVIVGFMFFKLVKHIVIVASRQVGKSYGLGIAICLIARFRKNERILILAPTKEQSTIIYKYVIKFLKMSPVISYVLDTKRKKDDLDKEVSKKRIVLSNGNEIAIMTTGQRGEGVLGQSPTTLIIDESQSVSDEAYDAIMGMMASVKESKPLIVEIGTAHIVNHFYRTYESAQMANNKLLAAFHITSYDGIKEGMIDADHIKQRKEDLSPVDFGRWYLGKFPTTGDDAVVSRVELKKSFDRIVDVKSNVIEMGLDVARFGDDSTVLAIRQGMKVFALKEWEKKNTMETSGICVEWINAYASKGYKVIINIDDDGLGGGVVDRLREIYAGSPYNVIINDMHNGSKAFNSELYGNSISELWFWIGNNIERLSLPKNKRVLEEFSSRKFKYLSDGGKILETKDQMKKRGLKSPDVADAISYAFNSEIYGGESPDADSGFC